MLRGAIRHRDPAPKCILQGVDNRQVPGCGRSRKEGRGGREVCEDMATLGGMEGKLSLKAILLMGAFHYYH